jgi:hypothetical protein
LGKKPMVRKHSVDAIEFRDMLREYYDLLEVPR